MTILRSIIIACTLLFGIPASFANDENSGTGTVAETMTSAGYVYVRLEEDGTWIAAQSIPTVVGDKVTYAGGMTMKDFHSRTLDRNFDYILFAGKLEVINPVNADIHGSVQSIDSDTDKKSTDVSPPQAGEIIPLEGGKIIADIHADLDQLKDQQIALRARVMKVSMSVMGKNWITMEDGTGVAPNNRLIATTSEVVGVGDLVTVKGVIHTNVDLGSGYNYTVLLEEATFTR